MEVESKPAPPQVPTGMESVVGEHRAKREASTEKMAVLVLVARSSNWRKSEFEAWPGSRWAVMLMKPKPVASRLRPVAPQPLSLRAVPAMVIEVGFCVTWPDQVE